MPTRFRRGGRGRPGLGPGACGAGRTVVRRCGRTAAAGCTGAVPPAQARRVAGRGCGPGCCLGCRRRCGRRARRTGFGCARRPGLGGRADVLPPAWGNDSRSLRATGASTVDDADLTNSPCSFNRSSTCLLVTPSSLANSCTRALPATPPGGRVASPPRPHGYVRYVLIVGTSRCAHVSAACLLTR